MVDCRLAVKAAACFNAPTLLLVQHLRVTTLKKWGGVNAVVILSQAEPWFHMQFDLGWAEQ